MLSGAGSAHILVSKSRKRLYAILASFFLLALVFSGSADAQPVEPTRFDRPATEAPFAELVLLSSSSNYEVVGAKVRSEMLGRYDGNSIQKEASTSRLTLGGALGGLAGLAGGAMVSAGSVDVGTAFLAIPIGITVGTPAGVHLANGARGSYSRSLLASAAIAAAGFLVHVVVPEDTSEDLIPLYVFALPIGQLMSSIAIERATAAPAR